MILNNKDFTFLHSNLTANVAHSLTHSLTQPIHPPSACKKEATPTSASAGLSREAGI